MFRNTSELDVEALFNASPNAYVLFDLNLTIVGCNEAYLEAVGRASRDEIVGKNVFVAFPSDPQSESYKLLRSSLDHVVATAQRDHLALIPYDITLPNGTLEARYWSATHTPIFGADGRLEHILQHTVDVTELQRLRAGAADNNIQTAGVLSRAAEVQAQNLALAREVDLVRSLFRQAPGFVAVLQGTEHVFQMANAAYESLVGRSDLVGRALADALPEVVDQGFVEVLDQVLATGEPFIGRGVAVRLATGESQATDEYFLDFIYQPILGADGRPAGIFVQGHDITAQKRFEQQLLSQTEMLRLAQEAGGFGTFEWDLSSGTLQASREFKRLYGLPEGDTPVPVSTFRERVHPEDVGRIATSPDRPLDEALKLTEYRVVHPDGETLWVARQGTVMLDDQGHPWKVVGAVQDITARKHAQARLEAVALESTHRIKNLLAMIQAIVSQTLRRAENLADASATLSRRIQALGAAQTALISGAEGASPLAEVVQGFVELHGDYDGRISAAGPDVTIDQRTALGLSLVLHELGTNAAKYGALSTDAGVVHITWSVPEGASFADFLWRESGGPPVTPPKRKGFGSSLIERMLTSASGKTARVSFEPDGVIFEATLNLDAARLPRWLRRCVRQGP